MHDLCVLGRFSFIEYHMHTRHAVLQISQNQSIINNLSQETISHDHEPYGPRRGLTCR